MKILKKRIAEYRTLPTNEKGLEEKRTDLMLEMNQIIEGAKAETRTLSDAENTKFEEIRSRTSAFFMSGNFYQKY